jgi:16S rRNA (uracil1498-N3)-methyltransferase
VTDGHGGWRECRAVGGLIEPGGEARYEPAPIDPLTIAFAIPKQDRPEWIVQKLTEIGVDRIVVLHAERSVVRWDPARAEKHLAKLRRVAREAMQQSRQVWLPKIDGPIGSTDLLAGAVVAEPGGRDLAAADRSIAIGPEGGWSPGELELAAGQVSLGTTVLRVETAALVAATRAIDHGM